MLGLDIKEVLLLARGSKNPIYAINDKLVDKKHLPRLESPINEPPKTTLIDIKRYTSSVFLFIVDQLYTVSWCIMWSGVVLKSSVSNYSWTKPTHCYYGPSHAASSESRLYRTSLPHHSVVCWFTSLMQVNLLKLIQENLISSIFSINISTSTSLLHNTFKPIIRFKKIKF